MFGGFTLAAVLNKAFYTTSDTYALWQRILKKCIYYYTTSTMVSFFATSTVVSCAQRKRKKYVKRGTLWAWRFHPAICQITPRGNRIVFQNVFSQNLKLLDTLQKRVVRKDTVRFKPPSQRKCHIYFGYNNSHLRFRGFQKNKWMTFVVLSGWGFEANSVEL